MVFLAPAAGLIGAALAVPALLLLYLLKLRRRPMRVSSTFLWEQTVRDEQANVPLRWLRASWPLAIQLLALLCLLAAIARPAIHADSSVASRVVLVIDRTASMSATDGQPAAAPGQPPRARLDQAKSEALRVIDDLRRVAGSARPEAMVIAVGAEARVAAGFTSDLRVLRDAVEGVQPSDQSGDAGWTAAAALIRAASGGGGVAASDEPEAPSSSPTPASAQPLERRTDVLVFSDGVIGALGSAVRIGRGVGVRLIPCGPSQGESSDPARPSNLGIVAINAQRDAESPATVRVFARVLNAGPEKAAVMLRATIDGGRVGALSLTVPASHAAADGSAAPGEAAGTLEIDHGAGGVLVMELLRDDLLASDNAAALVLSPIRPARVLVVGPGTQSAGDPFAGLRGDQGVDRLLLNALRELRLAEVRVVDLATYEAGASGDEDWNRFDLVVFDRTMPRIMPRAASLSFGAGTVARQASGKTASHGVIVEPLPPDESRSASTRFISWRRTHPLLRSIPLDAVMASPPMRMTLPAPDDHPGNANVATEQVTPLAFGIGGPLIALVEEPGAAGVKRVVVALDLLSTNWGKDVSFPIFVATAVEYLTGRGESAVGRFATTREGVTVRATPGVRTITASGPTMVRADVDANGVAALGVPERVGVYTVEGAIEPDRVFAANLVDAAESSLRIGRSTRAAFLPSASHPASPADARTGESPSHGIREVWHWFVMLAAALLAVEWFVYAWRVRV